MRTQRLARAAALAFLGLSCGARAATVVVPGFDIIGFPLPREDLAPILPKATWISNDVFVVTWIQPAPGPEAYGKHYDVMMQPFNADGGNSVNGQYRLATIQRALTFEDVAVKVVDDAHFLVVWPDKESYTPRFESPLDFDLYGQLFNLDTSAAGLRFPVDTILDYRQVYPVILPQANHRFAVVHRSEASVADGPDIYAQRFSIDGKPVGTQVRLNSVTTDFQTRPAGDCDARARCLLVWASLTSDFTSGQMKGQYFDGTMAPVGSEFEITPPTPGGVNFSSVAMDAAGRAAVTWAMGNPLASLQMARYKADHTPLGAAITLSTAPQTQGYVARAPSGETAVVYSELASGKSRVYLRDYSLTNALVARTKLAEADDAVESLLVSTVAVNANKRAVVLWLDTPKDPNNPSVSLRAAIIDGIGVAPPAKAGPPVAEEAAASAPAQGPIRER